MVVRELTLMLSDELAREADANGLLTPEAVERLLREEIRRRHIDEMFAAADRLAAVSHPPLSERELEDEIAAARDQRRQRNASGH